MKAFKDLLAEQLLYKRVHCKCDCIIPLDFFGYIKDYEINNNEIVYLIDNKGKIIRIGENHPNLYIEIV